MTSYYSGLASQDIGVLGLILCLHMVEARPKTANRLKALWHYIITQKTEWSAREVRRWKERWNYTGPRKMAYDAHSSFRAWCEDQAASCCPSVLVVERRKRVKPSTYGSSETYEISLKRYPWT